MYALKRIGIFFALSAVVISAPLKEEPLRRVFNPVALGGETRINAFAQSASGQLIAAATRICFYQDGQWETLPEPSKSVIRGLVADGNTLWVISPGEIGHMTLPLTNESKYEPLDVPGLKSAGDLWQLIKAGSDLITNTSESVWIINPKTGTSREFPLPNKYRTVLVPLDDHLVVAQPNVGLWEVKNGELIPLQNPLPDQHDTFWLWSDSNHLVTATKLFQRVDGEFREKLPLTNLNRSVVTSIGKWDRFLAIATYTKGLILLDPESGETIAHEQLPGETARGALATFVDVAGHLWVGTNNGVEMFESLRFGHRIAPSANPIDAVRDQGLVVSFDDHTDYFHADGREEHFERAYFLLPTRIGLVRGGWGRVFLGDKSFSAPANFVKYIKELEDGRLLAISGRERLHLIEPEKGVSTLILETKDEIRAATVNRDGIWITRSDHTLLRADLADPYKFDEVAKISGAIPYLIRFLGNIPIFTSEEGVSFGLDFQPVISAAGLKHARLAETAGKLWLCGEQDGVQRLGQLKINADKVVWETVEAKGLSSLSEINAFSANEGILTFCGDSTILELNVAALAPSYRLAPPALTFAVQDQSHREISHDRPPETLKAEINRLTFRGSTTFDEFGERPGFERRLLPTDSTWTSTKPGETVIYPSLSARTYQLQVRATHLGRIGETKSFTFEVLPPWYASKLALVSYVVLAAAASYLGYRWRTRQILHRNEELERLIEIRTRDLAKASAAKTEFLASMSHEIRNPMNGVVGLVTILRDQSLGNPRQMHTLKMLSNCADQLRSTVDDILDFSKIEAGKVGLETTTFNLLDTLDASAATVDAAGNTVRFLDRPRADLLLSGDAAKLRQIFANYLSNALKYGVPPEARVSTILTPKSDGIQLTLSVTSSGPTIDKDTLDKFFDSFTRGDEAVERNIRGTGLGLAICRRYAQAMGGDVGAVSNNGETTFYLTVPFKVVSEDPNAVVTAPILPVSSLPAKALAIEDEDYNRVVLGSILAKMNYTVDWATTGREALQLARENGYDIILTDYRLPDTNGVELTKEILRLCTDPKPAVFAVTAYSTRERRQECMNAGMSGFISKPITLEKLRSTLANWGEKNMAKISLEISRPREPQKTPLEVEQGWNELRNLIGIDRKAAAESAHALNNLCRSHYLFDLAEQLELLEGALERGDSTEKIVAAVERLFPATVAGRLS